MKAAHTRRIINPQLPFKMEGYNDPRYCLHQNKQQKENLCAEGTRSATGIRDDLYLDCLLLQKDTTLVFFMIDACIAEEAFVSYCKEFLCKHTNLHHDHISIGTTHTHSGPLLSHGMYFNLEPDMRYWETLAKTMLSCIEEAKQHVETCICKIRETRIEGFYNNRNRPTDEYFNKVIELKFETTEGRTIADVLNLAVHPTILGADNYALSNDFFAPLRTYLQGFMACPIMYFNGEAGDSSPRIVKQATDYQECLRYGKEIGKQILQYTEEYKLIDFDFKQVLHIPHIIDYNPKENDFLKKKKVELEKEISQLDPTSEQYHRLSTCYLYDVNEKLSHEHLHYESYALVYDFKDVRIVTIPAEIDTILGERLRYHDQKQTIVWAYTNGFNYYAVNEREYGKVFESFNTFYPYQDADIFVSDILDAYHKEEKA